MKSNLILASQSPRRHDLLKAAGYEFEVRKIDVEEIHPEGCSPEELVIYLSELKSKASQTILKDHITLLTADTIVVLDGSILGKPKDRSDAISTLEQLSNRAHVVHTGVTVAQKNTIQSDYDTSIVHFCPLERSEIEFYIDQFHPLDKAGSYGIQDWLGLCKVKRIEGSHSNIMGLPMELTYRMLASMGVFPKGLYS